MEKRHDGDVVKTIDLFCGAGGITEGFRQAGFECVFALDNDPNAVKTFRHNHPGVLVCPDPIESVYPDVIRRLLGLEQGAVDVLVGGSPCQGFSINAPERFLDDPRNSLFRHFVRFLEEFKPQAFMFENVPGMVSLAGGRIFEQVMSEFENRGYAISAKILYAAHYGVPQERWRLVILGSQCAPAPAHPYPIYYANGRANFRGGRTMTFRKTSLPNEELLPFVTVGEAISDLPRLKMGEGDEIVLYDTVPTSDFAKSMRNPEGHTYNHFAARLSERNAERMRYIPPGGSWRDIPHHLLPKGMQRARRSDHTKRYGRLEAGDLAGTIMTKCDPHWGAVFLPDQDRALTVREAARLQSFPDTYRFLGPRVAQYLQVGNAVPVLLAKSIAARLREHLDGKAERTDNYAGQDHRALRICPPGQDSDGSGCSRNEDVPFPTR